MKKIIFALFTLLAIFCFCVAANAQTLTNKDLGMTFTVPDSYKVEFGSDENIYVAEISIEGDRVGVNLMSVPNPDAYFEGLLPDERLKDLLENMASTERLTQMLTSDMVTFTKKDVYTTSINDIKCFVYDGTYITSGVGFETETFYNTAYAWAKNGRVYYMEYYRFSGEADIFRPDEFLKNADFEIGEIKIYVNGNRIYSDTAAAAVNGRTIVPIRAVAEAMNYKVNWDGENKLITLNPLSGEGNNVIFGLECMDYKVNDETKQLDVPAIAVNGRTYIPLRAAAEAVGGNVEWDSNTNSAYITY